MITTLADPYLAANAGRRYPLADDTTGLADASLVDFRAAVSGVPTGTAVRAVLVRIGISADDPSVRELAVDLLAGETVLAALVFPIPADLASKSAYTAIARTTAAVGALTVMAAALDEDLGDYEIPFAATTVSVRGLGVDSIVSDGCRSRLPTDPDLETPVTGAVRIDPGYNTDPYLDGNRLHLDIVKGAGIGEWCQTEATGQTCDNVLFTINGERPGSDGNVNLVGESGIEVIPHPETHEIEIRLGDAAKAALAEDCERTCTKKEEVSDGE